MKVGEINSLQELIEHLEADRDQYNGDTWYRGQANATWSLVPGFYRKAIVKSEASLLKQFRQSAAMLTDATPEGAFEWLFHMQHYGVPTRLLDWSENPLIALYFAIEDFELTPELDAALWCLYPTELNKHQGINNAEEQFFIPSFEDEELASYTVKSLSQNSRTQMKPLATIATRNNARIQAQLGTFTIHHHDRTPIENIGDQTHVIKYVIPAAAKAQVAKQIKVLGFTKFQLFPELASIGDIIKGGLE